MKTINAFGITFLFLILLIFLLDCCTLSVTTIHTQGKAVDVMDEAQTNQPHVIPTISIPAL